MGEVSDAVKKSCGILRSAKDDTEKFAGLFLVTKLVKGKSCGKDAKKLIFNSIGFDFLRRLLLTNDVPVDCPPSMYKSLALNILQVFCYEEELVGSPEMLEFCQHFLEIVRGGDENDDNLLAIGEAYKCLMGIASYPAGQDYFIEHNFIEEFIQIYKNGTFESDEALKILSTLWAKCGTKAWTNFSSQSIHELLNKLSMDFENEQDKRKFELSEVINNLLYNCPKKLLLEEMNGETWPGSLYRGLNDILTSKIAAAQRNPALILTSTLLDILKVDWSLQDEHNPKKFFLLLIQLAAIEVRMQLEGKQLKSILLQANLITSCFVILELSINFITNDQLELDQKEKQTLYTGLKGCFNAVINMLGKVNSDQKKPQNEEKLFICATIRVLVAWLSQEPTAMRGQVLKLLPYLLELSNETFYAFKARKTAEKSGTAMETEYNPLGNVDILRIMLPALCHLTVEDEARNLILKAKQDEILFEVLEFHWTRVNYKRPPVPRSERLKQLSQPQEQLSPEILEEMEDARVAMISTCNVLMNLTVLETKHVEKSATFNNLLKFIFENLPELKNIPENLVLHANLAVLGLLLLKPLSSKVKKNDFSICRYIQATIRFLWDAYNLDESNDPTALVVSLAYKEHWFELMELWFLGMQTMSAVLAQIPWVSDFAIESGWAEGIIQILKKVKIGTLPQNVKSAYEDFLCHLVDANEDVVEVLKKAEALKVCRNHRLMELGKKLFGD